MSESGKKRSCARDHIHLEAAVLFATSLEGGEFAFDRPSNVTPMKVLHRRCPDNRLMGVVLQPTLDSCQGVP